MKRANSHNWVAQIPLYLLHEGALGCATPSNVQLLQNLSLMRVRFGTELPSKGAEKPKFSSRGSALHPAGGSAPRPLS